MSKQIQIRRGTSDEHLNFTGAVGEVTMDTTDKTLRLHDGVTAGGIVFAKQSELEPLARRDELEPLARRDELVPSTADYITSTYRKSDGKTWYRKYKSGWIEQGGYFELSGSWAAGNEPTYYLTLPVAMKDNKYTISMARGTTTGQILMPSCINVQKTGFQISNRCIASSTFVCGWWTVYGYFQ